jgi:hypothetical protein
MNEAISAEDISMAAGVLLSLGFSYVPGLREKFDRLSPTQKRLLMLALLVLVSGSVFGLSCLNTPLYGTCDQDSAWTLLRALILAVIANQSTYALSPKAAGAARRATASEESNSELEPKSGSNGG